MISRFGKIIVDSYEKSSMGIDLTYFFKVDPSRDINCDSLGRSLDLLDPLTKVTETGNMISIENDDD